MHCLLTAIGSYGDVFPMIGLGAALKSRGWRVTIATNPHFASEVAAAGLELEAISTADRYDTLTRDPKLWSAVWGLGVVFRQGALAVLEELYGLIERCYTPGETVIAAHGLDLSSRIAAETLGAPVASIVYAPMALWSEKSPPRAPAGFAPPGAPNWLHRLHFFAGEKLLLDRVVRPKLNDLRAKHGLPPIAARFWDWYYGVAPPICLFPDWFVSPDCGLPNDWPAGTATTGFPMGDSTRDPTLSPEVEAFLDAGDPPIAFTPGSAMRRGERFFAAAVDACRRLGRRGVLLTKYADQLPANLPDTILAPGFTPLAKLLERSAAFVHHGGIGSSARGLAAGVPQLIQPMAFDQYDNAWRLRCLGIADELPPRRFTGRRAAEKLDRLLNDPGVSQACERWKERVDPEQALAAASGLLESRLGDAVR